VYRTIPDLLAEAVGRAPDDTWLRTDDGTVTFAVAGGLVGATAVRLEDAGVRRGDRVLVTAKNTPSFLLLWLALASMGAVEVPANPKSTPAELAGLIGQVTPRAVVTDSELREVVDEAATFAGAAGSGGTRGSGEPGGSGDPGILDVDAMVPDWTAPFPESADLPKDAVGPDDLAVLLPTSGTTGRSKLVMQTHRTYSMAGEGFPYWMELDRADRLMTSLPLFHVNALAYSVMGSLSAGAGLVLLPVFSASRFLDSARRHGATEFNAIGAMLEILMRQPERPDDADTPLRLCYTGPAPTRERQLEIERRFGLRIVCGYAMSETTYGLIWPHGTRPYGSLGAPRQHPTLGHVNDARLVDDAGADLGPGSTGEILLKNPAVTPGYWGMPEETAVTLDGGWVHTGDIATLNADGTFTFVGRKKEVLRRRGENVSPLEIEDALSGHPDVLECAVVGVASDLSEDDIKAFVVLAPGRGADFEALRTWVADRLSPFKVPRYWQQVDELPHTPTGRLAKHRLPDGHPDGEYDADQKGAP
jgi:carnitine-CoA ligase